jgi:putative oxidoreductase
MAFLISAYSRFLAILGWLRWLPPLVARLAVGLTFHVAGGGKLQHLDKVTRYFSEDLHIPHPHLNAIAAACTEYIGGALLMAGLLTRFASIALIVVFCVAIVTAKMSDVHELGDLIFLPEFLSIVLMAYLVVEGPGCISLDQVAAWFFGKKTKSSSAKGGSAESAKSSEKG